MTPVQYATNTKAYTQLENVCLALMWLAMVRLSFRCVIQAVEYLLLNFLSNILLLVLVGARHWLNGKHLYEWKDQVP